jgi:hypothetical protein
MRQRGTRTDQFHPLSLGKSPDFAPAGDKRDEGSSLFIISKIEIEICCIVFKKEIECPL